MNAVCIKPALRPQLLFCLYFASLMPQHSAGGGEEGACFLQRSPQLPHMLGSVCHRRQGEGLLELSQQLAQVAGWLLGPAG